MTQLIVDSLKCELSGKERITELSFSCLEVEHLALVGRNGAGKTTLLRCLLAQQAYRGRIDLDGEELRSIPAYKRAQKVAYVPQRLDLFFSYSVLEFIELAQFSLLKRTSSGYSQQQTEKYCSELREQALEKTATGDLLKRSMTGISMGERQRVLLAAALAQGAKLLLLDEPTAFLDPKGVEQFFSLLSSLKSDTSFILATHELNYAAALCSRVLALSGGRLFFDGATKEFISRDNLKSVFDVEPSLLTLPGSDVSLLLPPGLKGGIDE